MSSLLGLFDANRPFEGAMIQGKEVRELLKSIATANAGSSTPGRAAILIGDIRFSTVSVATRYRLSMSINGVDKIIDLTSVASHSEVTPANVVSAINAAFSGSGETYAYTYSPETFDGTAVVALVVPNPSGSTATITINELTDGTDASSAIFGVQGRNVGMPYTVTAATPPYGLQWLQTTDSGDEDNIKLFLGTPARATGLVNLATSPGTVNLSVRSFLRIRIVSNTGVAYGPLTIDVKGASPSATLPSEIVNAINTAFTAAPGWPNALSGPARLVAKAAGSQYLQILSGPVASPFIGPNAAVEISGLAIGGSLGVNFLIDDAITDIMGLPRGEAGKLIGRVPHVFRGSDFSNAYIRGIGNRSGAGIGPWGPALESAGRIPASGAVDGETRIAKDTGIPWIYREGQFGLVGSGWRRAVPGYEYPVAYDKVAETYRLKSTNDTFVPVPLSKLSYNVAVPDIATNIEPNNLETGRIGDVVTLVDAKDFLWKTGNYTGGRNLFALAPMFDNFPITRYTLGRSVDRINWKIVDGNSPAITGTNNQRFRPTGSNIAQTEALGASTFSAIRAYCEGAGEVRNYQLPVQTATTSFSFTIPDIAGSTPIKPFSFSIRVSPASADPSTLVTATPDNYIAYDNGAGVIGGGTGITGTINYTTGAVALTTSTALSYTTHMFTYAYARSNLQVVSIDVRKNPALETRAGGTPAEAGIIYAAPGTSSGVDTGAGFAAIVRDDGSGSIVSLTSGTATPLAVFLVDPPLDTTWRTLRVLYQVEAGSPSNIAVHSVFWNGSNKACDWTTKDYAQPDASLTASQTDGGTEVERVSKLINLTSYTATGAANESGSYGGIWAKGSSASGGYGEKGIQVRNFQNHSGNRVPFTSTIPALPPVSGVRLRDIVGAIQLSKGGVIQTSPVSVITDCNARTPLVLNLAGDLGLSNLSSIGSDGRTINIGLDSAAALAPKDAKYLRTNLLIPGRPGYLGVNSGGADLQNIYGRVAYWDLSSMLVDHNFIGGGSTAGYSTVPVSFIDTPYLWRRHHDGSTAGTTVGQDTGFNPVRYWSPENAVGANPNPAEFSGLTPTWALNPSYQGFNLDFCTTLPEDGFNGINWTYHVLRAQLVTVRSGWLTQPRPASGWPATTGPGTTTIWSVNEPYTEPHIDSITRIASTGQSWAKFRVRIYYFGPVCPVGIYLSIMATRRGTV